MAFTDNFTGTSGDNLEGRSGWTRVDGAAGAAQINASNQLKGTTGTNTAYTCTDQGSANHYTQYVVKVADGGNASFESIRTTDSNNFIGIRAYLSTPKIQMYKRDTGSFSLLGTGTTTVAVDDTAYIEGDGNNITAKLNGSTEVGPVTETFNNTETAQGLVIRAVDDPLIDDFEAGALGGAGASVSLRNKLLTLGVGA